MTGNGKLIICGDLIVNNPTEPDIRQAVYRLGEDADDAFLILEQSEMTYLQTSGDPEHGFLVEYQEADTDHHYRARQTFDADEVVKAFWAYAQGTQEWKDMAQWEKMTL